MKKKPVHIADFIKVHGQCRAAEILHCSQSNISQIMASKREIYITCIEGVFSFYEIKHPPLHRGKKKPSGQRESQRG